MRSWLWLRTGQVMLVTLSQAITLLDRGQVVAIPTETVYGLAADAANDAALTLLYQTKGRPHDHPVILHVADLSMARPFLGELPQAAERLAAAFWPGPLTMLLPRSDRVSARITGNRPLVGVRAPAAALALELLNALGRPLVAPSANRFGHISPTSAAHVEEEFGGEVAVLDGGPCTVGLESTIVAIEAQRVVVMRPGQLSMERLAEVSGLPVEWPDQPVSGVPGALKSHYAPRQPVSLMSARQMTEDNAGGAAILCIAEGTWPEACLVLRMPPEPDLFARRLYGALREAEASEASRILVELPPDTPDWRAVRDRLQRSSVH